MQKTITIILVICLWINVASLNYLVGSLSGISGQTVSMIVIVLCAVILFRERSELSRSILITRIAWLTIATLFFVPLFGYLINYHGQTFEVFQFWFKRVSFNIISLAVSAVLFNRLASRTLVLLSETMLATLCIATIFSYFFPWEAIAIFTGGEQIWGDLAATSVSRAFGFSLNSNDAGFALLASYAAYHAILHAKKLDRSLLHLIAADLLFIVSLLLTGSRANAPIGILMVLFTILSERNSADSARSSSSTKARKRVLYISAILIVASLMFSEASDSTAINRIVLFLTNSEDIDNASSNDLRSNALKSGIDLISSHPIVGIGFEDSTVLLDVLPHNSFVVFALNNGLILLLVYIILVYTIFWELYRIRMYYFSAVYMILIVGVSFSSPNMLEAKQFPWLIASVALLIHSRRSEESARISRFSESITAHRIP
jgi:O-antigen ligase